MLVVVVTSTCDLRGGQRGGGRGRYNSLKMRLTTRRREHALRAFVVALFSTSLIHKEMGTPRLTRALFCFASLFLTKFDANPHFVWTEKKKNGPSNIVSREMTRSLALRATHSFVDDILGALNSSIFPSLFVFFLSFVGSFFLSFFRFLSFLLSLFLSFFRFLSFSFDFSLCFLFLCGSSCPLKVWGHRRVGFLSTFLFTA